MEVLTRRKDLEDGARLNCLRQSMENGVWLRAIVQHLNGTELSREEFQCNLLI